MQFLHEEWVSSLDYCPRCSSLLLTPTPSALPGPPRPVPVGLLAPSPLLAPKARPPHWSPDSSSYPTVVRPHSAIKGGLFKKQTSFCLLSLHKTLPWLLLVLRMTSRLLACEVLCSHPFPSGIIAYFHCPPAFFLFLEHIKLIPTWGLGSCLYVCLKGSALYRVVT